MTQSMYVFKIKEKKNYDSKVWGGKYIIVCMYTFSYMCFIYTSPFCSPKLSHRVTESKTIIL